jgi:phage head maturation protease
MCMDASAFTIGTKGLNSATTLATGELAISGYLTRWHEIDRDQEAFVRGSVTAEAIRKFLSTHAPLCYGHRLRDVVGRVLSLESDGVGLKMVAKIARPAALPAHLKWIREAVKDKLITGLSMGAVFTRSGNQIVDADLVEASLTATPKLTTTSLEVIGEGKALEFWGLDRPPQLARAQAEVDRLRLRLTAADIRAEAARTRALLRL